MVIKRIGIDIDGTITTMDIVVDIFNRETGKNLGIEDLTIYDVGDIYGLSKEEAGRIWGTYTKELVDRSIPIWDIKEFMRGWETYGTKGKEINEIVIVTARPIEYKEVTINWLKRNKIRYDEIYFGYNKKIDAVRELFLDVFIDDKADNIKDIDESEHLGCVGYVADQPYNRWYDTKNRVYTKGIIKNA